MLYTTSSIQSNLHSSVAMNDIKFVCVAVLCLHVRLNMIKLYSLKPQGKDGSSSAPSGGGKRASAAQLRVTKGKMG